MATKKATHLHKYKKVDLSRTKDRQYLVYKCMNPTCYHYIPIALSEGKLCECNRCGEPMVITHYTLTGNDNGPMSKPHCQDCTKRKKASDVEAISRFLEGNKT